MRCVSAIFILFLSLSALGEIDWFARSNTKQTERTSRLSLRRRQFGQTAGQKRIGRLNSLDDSFNSALFSEPMRSETQVLLAGALDGGFGVGGKVTTQVGNSRSEASAVALQSDGRFVAAGYSFNGANDDFALVRYNADGTLDTNFGSGGKVTIDIGNAGNSALAVAVQPADGKIIAAGNSNNGSDDDFALVRYNPNGTLDTTFGAGGIVTTDFGNSSEYIDAVVIQTDGKIVAAGYRLDGSYFDFALARYNADGTLDATFGNNGKVTTVFTAFDDLARAIALQADGKIVVAGEADADFAVARYNSDGSPDASFDGDGKAVTSINIYDAAYDVAVQTDGSIVAAGEEGDGTNSDFALVRYTASGALESTFGSGGIVTTAIGASDEFALSLVLQTSGKIIAGGFSFNGRNDDFALVRYNSDGTLDSSFGTGGKVTTDFNSSFDDVSALTIQSDNRIIAVGGSNFNFAAAAYYLQTITCSYSLSPTAANFPASGGTGSFNITSTAGCSYAAVSNDSFITITNGGSGSGTVSFSVGTNSGGARAGTVTVGGQTFTVNQAAVLTYEADVSPRGELGDGRVSSLDVSIIQGFQLGFGLPYQGNEFQRADCAPFSDSPVQRGDGRITSIDVAQAQAYQLGFNLAAGDALQPAAGPTAPVGGAAPLFELDSLQSSGKPSQTENDGARTRREVRVAVAVASAAQTVVVPIAADASGDESVYGFSLDYDSTKLSNPVVSIGTAGGSVSSNTTQSGKIGISVSFGGATIAAGNNQTLVIVRFAVAENAARAATDLTFGDAPAFQEVASGASNPNGVRVLSTIFRNGFFIVNQSAGKPRKRIKLS